MSKIFKKSIDKVLKNKKKELKRIKTLGNKK
jgi:hypothetical protein